MSNMVGKLEKHFRETPREKVLSDWAETTKNARRGPTVKQILKVWDKNKTIENLKPKDNV